MQTTIQASLTVAVIALVTFGTRALPFLVFRKNKPVPAFVSYLGKVLPFAIIGMLVIYCLKDVDLFSSSYGIPELIGIIVVIILHKIKHNMLISIAGATVVYMVLLQFVFV